MTMSSLTIILLLSQFMVQLLFIVFFGRFQTTGVVHLNSNVGIRFCWHENYAKIRDLCKIKASFTQRHKISKTAAWCVTNSDF